MNVAMSAAGRRDKELSDGLKTLSVLSLILLAEETLDVCSYVEYLFSLVAIYCLKSQ